MHGRAPGLHREGRCWPCQPARPAWGQGEAARLGWLSPAQLGRALPFLGPRCTASLPPGWPKWTWPLHKSVSFPGPPSSLSEMDFVQDMPQQICPTSHLHPQTSFRTGARAVVHLRGTPLSLPRQRSLLRPPGRCYVPRGFSEPLLPFLFIINSTNTPASKALSKVLGTQLPKRSFCSRERLASQRQE